MLKLDDGIGISWRLAVLAVIGAGLVVPTWARARTASGTKILSNAQLDGITAGGDFSMDLDLNAYATSRTATTTTFGAVHIGGADVIRIDTNPKTAGPTGTRYLGSKRATILYGGGEAAANGAADSNCNAKLTVVAPTIDYLRQSQFVTTTPTSAICTCAAFAISFAPR